MKLQLIAAAAALAAVSIMASGCSTINRFSKKTDKVTTATVQTTDNAQRTTETVQEAPAALLGEWSIIEVDGHAVVINGENHPKLTFAQMAAHPDQLRVIGFNGCNYINGDWQFAGQSIKPAGEFISSLRACPDAPYEARVNQAVNSVASYSLTDADNLSLLDASGKTVMRLRSRNLSFLNGAWRVTSIHGTPVPAEADIKVVIDIDECRLHGNAGCNVLNGDVTVNLDKGNGLEFKNLATSRMMCPYISTEQDFLLALEETDTAVRGDNGSEALLKDSQGRVVITLVRLSPDQLAED